MSTYQDQFATQGAKGVSPPTFEVVCVHSWADFTKARLEWLYGPNQAIERLAQTQADIAAWRRLGTRTAA